MSSNSEEDEYSVLGVSGHVIPQGQGQINSPPFC